MIKVLTLFSDPLTKKFLKEQIPIFHRSSSCIFQNQNFWSIIGPVPYWLFWIACGDGRKQKIQTRWPLDYALRLQREYLFSMRSNAEWGTVTDNTRRTYIIKEGKALTTFFTHFLIFCFWNILFLKYELCNAENYKMKNGFCLLSFISCKIKTTY